MDQRRAIMWFRSDLRIHDNEALVDAIRQCDEVIPVYIFDTRLFQGKTSYGFPKIQTYRARFLWEAVVDLRQSLQKLGGDLIIRTGIPENEIYNLAKTHKTSWVFCNRERTEEEVSVQDALEKKLWSIGQEMRYYRGKMLYYTSDLPFPITHTPDTFSQFRKEVERFVPVRQPLPAPQRIPFRPSAYELGELPSWEELGISSKPISNRAAHEFKGGESEGLCRLQYYIWGSEAVATYKKTRNELLGSDYSSKLSPYLAHGCLSPKMIYHEVQRFEQKRKKNKSTYWLVFELMWRDFFRFMAKKHRNKIFLSGGIQGKQEVSTHFNEETFSRWAKGRTGIPFIDANMIELNQTGYMSNRGRQNVASFLIKDLGIHWLAGAEYFESLLIDYDPASNYGNWNYIAGVGSDPMNYRYFNILHQAKRYDPEGEFVKHWIPSLTNLPKEVVHEPYKLNEEDLSQYDFSLSDDYCESIVQPNW